MFIGILSDTHDHLPLIARAVKTLNEEGVELVLHAGDYVSPFVIPRLRELKAPIVGIFGNNDGDRELIRKRASEMEGFEIRGDFALLEVQGARIALLHGSDRELTEVLRRHNGLQVLVHGHTHRASIERGEGPLVVNPGEACGHLTGTPTIAILETEGLQADIIEL